MTKRAEAVGVAEESLDAADDAAELVELIVARETERITVRNRN